VLKQLTASESQTIYSHSKSSLGYGPENLLRYRSSDAKSRWSAPITTKGGFIDESDRPFVILELKEPAVLSQCLDPEMLSFLLRYLAFYEQHLYNLGKVTSAIPATLKA
jgi:hypothetical protein